jgi:hypothetical protein
VRAARLSQGSPVIAGSRLTATNPVSAYGVVAGISGADTGETDVTLRGDTIDNGNSLGYGLYANGAGSTGTQTIVAYDTRVDGARGLNAANGGVIDLLGGIVAGTNSGGTLHCAGSYKADFTTALTAACG